MGFSWHDRHVPGPGEGRSHELTKLTPAAEKEEGIKEALARDPVTEATTRVAASRLEAPSGSKPASGLDSVRAVPITQGEIAARVRGEPARDVTRRIVTQKLPKPVDVLLRPRSQHSRARRSVVGFPEGMPEPRFRADEVQAHRRQSEALGAQLQDLREHSSIERALADSNQGIKKLYLRRAIAFTAIQEASERSEDFRRLAYSEKGMKAQLKALNIPQLPGETVRDTYARARQEAEAWFMDHYGIQLHLFPWDSESTTSHAARDQRERQVETFAAKGAASDPAEVLRLRLEMSQLIFWDRELVLARTQKVAREALRSQFIMITFSSWYNIPLILE